MKNVIEGKTTTGFAFRIDPEALNDMELLEAIGEVEDNPIRLPAVIEGVLGKDQKKAFYDFHRMESGRVPIDVISGAFVEILSSSGQGKNS